MMTEETKLREIARKVRLDVLHMTSEANSSHIGSNYSMIEILVYLYSIYLNVDISRPNWNDRDRFILSKGHACASLYSVLAKKGFFDEKMLSEFCKNGGNLPGHATHHKIPGVEISTGSLGHGLGVACGMALYAKRNEKKWKTVCLISDGECNEGSIWEAALFAPHHKLNNLTCIIDYNKIQSLGTTQGVLGIDPLHEKWQSFGWHTIEINGHNFTEIKSAFDQTTSREKPTCIIANTVKGKGVAFMENTLLWHYRTALGEEYQLAEKELLGNY